MRPKGLYKKYNITKTDGMPVDQEAEYFVLRLDTDRYARTAAKSYARACRFEDRQLALDLLAIIRRIEKSKERHE